MKTKFAFSSPIYLLPFCFLLGVSFTAFYVNSSKANERKLENDSHFKIINQNKYKTFRLSGYDFIRPLLFVDDVNESLEFIPLKQKIKQLIEKYAKQYGLSAASVYMNTFSKGWMSYNEQEDFHPGNFNSIPLMIAYLKMSEIDPQLLDRKLSVKSNSEFTSNKLSLEMPQVEAETSYSIKELLYYMVSFSDLKAYKMLSSNVDQGILQNVYVDLGLSTENVLSPDYNMTSKEISRFLRVLYNSTYLNNANSEYALKLLNNSNVKARFKNSFPEDTKMICTTGSFTNGNEYEMHESGIIYLDSVPCLLTVMTRGNDAKKLPEFISSVSKLAFNSLVHP